MPRVRLGVGLSELFKLRNGNQGVIEMSHIEKFWRPATDKDVVDVMNGKEVEARFRDDEEDGWHICVLRGWRTASVASRSWLDSDLDPWTFCQVYAPPQWYLNKPEPGEGFRLLGKFPDEPVQGGDFAFDRSTGWIELRKGCSPTHAEGIWYRRRIEQPKPEPKHYVLRVGDTAEFPDCSIVEALEKGVWLLK
jgi:hypothetical protein